MRVYLCEDDVRQRERLAKHVRDYIMFHDHEMELFLQTDNPHEVLTHVKKDKKPAVYFLDIDLGDESMTGMMLAHEIRKYDPQGSIIFVTSHSELTYLTFVYKVEALDFIIKDDHENMKERVRDCLMIVKQRLAETPTFDRKRFVQKIGEKIISVYLDEIMFFESIPSTHKVILHLENRQVEFYGKLKEIVEMEEQFFRCHNAYVVNLKNISEVDKKSRQVSMSNGSACYSSARHIRGLLTVIGN